MIAPFFAFALLGLLVLVVIGIVALGRLSAMRGSLDQIPQIIARVYSLEQRLAAMERKLASLGQAAAGTQAEPAAATTQVVDTLRPATPHVEPPPKPTEGIPAATEPSVAQPVPTYSHPPHALLTPTTTATSSAHLPPSIPHVHAVTPAVNSGKTDLESLIAGRWLNVLGIVALVLAAAFFLKYAFDNDWIGPMGRVGTGIAVGVLMFPLSDWLLHRGYKFFSEGIVALGVVILYLSVWTGWHYYDLFPQAAAFGFMVLITAATIVVALVRDSQWIAVLALAGGSLTPILTSTGENKEEALFVYLAILGAGAISIAWARKWKGPLALQFAATVLYFWAWYSEFYSERALNETLTFATIFFALFAVLPAFRAIRKTEVDKLDIAITLANGLQFLCVLGALLWPESAGELAIALLILGAMHLLAALALPKAAGTPVRAARILYGGLALTFATIAIPVWLNGEWITIAFAVEAAALIWGGLRIGSAPLRGAALVIYALIVIRLFVDASVLTAPTLFLNERFLTFAIGAASMFAAFLMVGASETQVGPFETRIYYALSVCANFVFLVALSMEVWDWFGRTGAPGLDQDLAQQLALSILWIVYASVLLAAGILRKAAAVRWQGLVLLGFAVAKVFLFDLSFLTRFYRIVSFFVLGLVLMLVSFLYQRRTAPGTNS